MKFEIMEVLKKNFKNLKKFEPIF